MDHFFNNSTVALQWNDLTDHFSILKVLEGASNKQEESFQRFDAFILCCSLLASKSSLLPSKTVITGAAARIIA